MSSGINAISELIQEDKVVSISIGINPNVFSKKYSEQSLKLTVFMANRHKYENYFGILSFGSNK
jgi:hypothetical protein